MLAFQRTRLKHSWRLDAMNNRLAFRSREWPACIYPASAGCLSKGQRARIIATKHYFRSKPSALLVGSHAARPPTQGCVRESDSHAKYATSTENHLESLDSAQVNCERYGSSNLEHFFSVHDLTYLEPPWQQNIVMYLLWEDPGVSRAAIP